MFLALVGEGLYPGVMPQTVVSKNVVRRWGAGTAAVVRLMVASYPPMTGVAIAAAAGVTQPRASGFV